MTADPWDRKATVLYDGYCEFCRRSVRLLKRLDWLDRLRFADGRDPETWPEWDVKFDPDRLAEEMHLVTPNGKEVYAGFDAFRWMAARVPILWATWPFLFVPGVPQIGRRLYRVIARHRFGLVTCKDGACELPQHDHRAESRGSLTAATR